MVSKQEMKDKAVERNICLNLAFWVPHLVVMKIT